MRSLGSKEINDLRGVWSRFPVQGALWLAGAVAITGAPPFGLFLSELAILRAGLTQSFSWAVYIMLALLIVIFVGFLNHFRVMYFEPGGERGHGDAVSLWCIAPMWFSLVPIFILGIWWPHQIWDHLTAIARMFAGAGS